MKTTEKCIDLIIYRNRKTAPQKRHFHGVMTNQGMRGIITKTGQKEGTGYVLLNRLHAVGFKKHPGQGEAPTPQIR
ncbi:hypothetical protein LHY41_004736 [Salmonella enterica]|nr:hypothetical protein [Salmonella enterica]